MPDDTDTMTDGLETPPDRSVLSNAGRCDLCGTPVDMRDSGDELVIQEFGIQDEELRQKHGLTDQDAQAAVADAMERVAESGAGLELARIIRDEGRYRVHNDCLAETNFSQLPTEPPESDHQ